MGCTSSLSQAFADALARFPAADPGVQIYLKYHAPRFQALFDVLVELHTPRQHILEIGRSPFSAIAAEVLNVPVDTLGLGTAGQLSHGQHHEFDLNLTLDESSWLQVTERYGVILFAEVVEHLQVPPDPVLRFLRSLMEDAGHVLLQTPNAVALHKRLRMISGRHPYGLLGYEPHNPAHFREYTRAELLSYCELSGMHPTQVHYANYFDNRYPAYTTVDQPLNRGWLNRLYDVVPGSLKPGLFLVLQAR